jgi:hypothetical protein
VVLRYAATLAKLLLPDCILLASCRPTFLITKILRWASAFPSRAVASSGFKTIAAFARAPFARLTVACEAHRPENLPAFIAGLGDIDTMFSEKLSALVFS